MSKSPSFLFVASQELFSFWSIVQILFFAFVYILLTLFLLNYRVVFSLFVHPFPVKDTVVLAYSLLLGLFTAFSPTDAWLQIIEALLIGINILLIIKTLSILQHSGKVHWSVGGATLLGIVATGCSSCGFSVLSVLGLGATSFFSLRLITPWVTFFPFHGLGIHLVSVAFLAFSAIYLL